ncbi:MAG: hypothetical protein AAGI01_16395 [Myxococcota bacterium]
MLTPSDAHDTAIISLTVGVLILATPLRAIWSGPGAPWWAPFLVWLLLIGAGAWVALRMEVGDGHQ